MDQLGNCYIEFEQYPQNLPNQDLSKRKLETYVARLEERTEQLFCDDARLSFWDLYSDADHFELFRAKSLEDVRRLCPLGSSQDHQDEFHKLDCRFIFLYSYNSKTPLYSTREMLMLALSYHTIDAWFLDYLFPFGEHDDLQDFCFNSCFRHKMYENPRLNLSLPHLDRTGHELHLCYNLRAPENTRSKQMPWSIRQTVLYHSFDLGSGQVIFLVLKGNDSMCKELRRETQNCQWKGPGLEAKIIDAFFSALKTHLAVCWWSCDNWQGYVNHLERSMNDLTYQAISEQVRRSPTIMRKERKPTLRRAQWSDVFHRTKTRTNTSISVAASDWLTGRFEQSKKGRRRDTKLGEIDVTLEEDCDPFHEDPYKEIEFPDLQRAQLVEEKANEAVWALKSNIKIITSLRDVYTNLSGNSVEVQKLCSWFSAQLNPVIHDLEMHQSSLETLARLFTERKNLLLGILEFQNMQASKYFAEKAQISADTMERMTHEMRELTRKTKDETVSMTVIAAVAMFFLPGTFVAALMSTDIVQWAYSSNGTYELQAAPGARRFFVAFTIPLMAVVFAFWGYISWRSRQRPTEDANSQYSSSLHG